MRRALSLLLSLALCLVFAACAQGGEPPAPPEAPGGAPETPAVPASAPVEPLALDALRVELVTGERDVDALLALQAALPQPLIDALGKRSVTVGSVAVTFGTSDEATVTALQNGAVDVGFVTAEGYLAHEAALRCVAVECGGAPDLSLGTIVLSADADDRLADALCDALSELAGTLAPYTGEAAQGRYADDAALLAQLREAYEKR